MGRHGVRLRKMEIKRQSEKVLSNKRRGGNKKPQTFRECAKCNQIFGPLERLSQVFCSKACNYASRFRKTVRKCETIARNAQSLLRYHVLKGNIKKPDTCEQCGLTGLKIEGAHKDYTRPLDVRWLCCSCHRKWDKKEPKGVTYKVPIINRWEKLTGKKAVKL